MEKPILFNTEMVKAILEGRKTQTRRLIRPQPEGQLSYIFGGSHPGKWTYMSRSVAKAWDVDESVIHEEEGKFWTPPCHGDDVLYVRETWCRLFYVDPDGYTHYDQEMYYYAADGIPDICLCDGDGRVEEDQRIRWKPSIHMPRNAARIFLKVKQVRVERLKDITEEDAAAEGCQAHSIFETARDYFAALWNTTQGVAGKNVPENWAQNPWVWVIDFERVEGKQNDE